MPILFAPRGDRQARDGGDGGKRLAAEAQGGDAFEIGERGDLAGRVPGEGERQVLARDAGAVVLDLDAPHAAFVERHADRARAGIEAVLEELLQDGGGTLDHFAGRNLGDEKLRQHADGAHGSEYSNGRVNSSPRVGTSPATSASMSPPSLP